MGKLLLVRIIGGLVLIFMIVIGSSSFWRKINQFRVIFCDVGQGDASLIVYKGFQVLVDAGPDGAVVDCLDQYMLFDKKIEFVILTHADSDHFGGMLSVFEYYQIENFVHTEVNKEDDFYQLFQTRLDNLRLSGNTKVYSFYANDSFVYGDMQIRFLWPTLDYVRNRLAGSNVETNDLSSVLQVHFREFDILISGDADSTVQPAMLSTGLLPARVEIATTPHHGSRTGMSERWLLHVYPAVAIISSGKNNSYGHPADKVISMLEAVDARVYRTDEFGNIEFVYDHDKLKLVEN